MQMAKVTVSQPDSVTASEGLVDRVEYDGTPVPAELVEFFADREGVLQVFEFDNDAVFDFNWRFFRNSLFCWIMVPVPPVCIPMWFCCVPIYVGGCAEKNIRDGANAQHICVTQDGIVYTVDRRKKCGRCDFMDEGKVTKTVPYDKLTDCDIEEPAGAVGPICCLVNKTLYTVTVDTVSGSGGKGPLNRESDDDCGGVGCGGKIAAPGGGHELIITGLKEPQEFKNLVWRMKRSGGPATAPAPGVVVATQPQAEGATSPLVGLLTEHNALQQQSLAKQDEILVELRALVEQGKAKS